MNIHDPQTMKDDVSSFIGSQSLRYIIVHIIQFGMILSPIFFVQVSYWFSYPFIGTAVKNRAKQSRFACWELDTALCNMQGTCSNSL